MEWSHQTAVAAEVVVAGAVAAVAVVVCYFAVAVNHHAD